MEYVYHGSKTSGIDKLEPRESTHGNEYVYATPSKGLAMVMSVHMTDLNARISGTGTKEDPVVIVERRPGIFNKYLHQDTNVYTLDGSDFYNATGWAGEVVSEKSQKVLNEEHVEDVYTELQNMEKEGTIQLYHYPNRPVDVPKDNSDLIAHWLDAENVKMSTKISQLLNVAIQYPNLIGKIVSESINRMKNGRKELLAGSGHELNEHANLQTVESEHAHDENNIDTEKKSNADIVRANLYPDYDKQPPVKPVLKSVPNPKREMQKNDMDR